MVKYLGKAEIFEAQDITFEEVEVPEWGGVVRIKALTGHERDGYEQAVLVRRGKSYEANLSDARAKLVARSIVDKDGNRIFGDVDIKALSQKSASALDRVFKAASQLSGISDTDMDELAKNYVSGQNGDSGSV